jgi:hypothetical protein
MANVESEVMEIDWALKAEEDLAYEPKSDLDSLKGREALAAAGGSYIRDRLREASFARKVMVPRVV